MSIENKDEELKQLLELCLKNKTEKEREEMIDKIFHKGDVLTSFAVCEKFKLEQERRGLINEISKISHHNNRSSL